MGRKKRSNWCPSESVCSDKVGPGEKERESGQLLHPESRISHRILGRPILQLKRRAKKGGGCFPRTPLIIIVRARVRVKERRRRKKASRGGFRRSAEKRGGRTERTDPNFLAKVWKGYKSRWGIESSGLPAQDTNTTTFAGHTLNRSIVF